MCFYYCYHILTTASQTKDNEAKDNETKDNETKAVNLPVNVGGKLCGYHTALALMCQHTLHQPLLHRRLAGGSARGQHIGRVTHEQGCSLLACM